VVEFGDSQARGRVRVIHLDAGPAQRIDKNAVVEHLPAFIANLERFVEREAIEHQVVHSHYWLSGWVGGRLGELWSVPHVTMFHTLGRVKNRANTTAGGRRGQLETNVRNEIERRIVRAADAIVASTEYERAALVEAYGARAERVTVIPAGVDLRAFDPVDRGMARAALDLRGEVLLFVGRLDPVKGLDTLLEAVKLLAHRPRLRLLIAGGSLRGGKVDADEEYLRHLARDLGIADRVEWLGPVDQERLPLYYSAADVCVVPSRYESFGLVALEAMACGAALVAAPVGGLPGIVRDGENGLLVPERKPELFAERIRWVLDDPLLAGRIRGNARRAVEAYSWSTNAERTRALYAKLGAREARAGAEAVAAV
jgi:D-inositol-3-phosphate glycosyltransferase